ncbi:hypothetical protein AAC387_Pa05g1212 [Persea americana]
MSCPPIRTHCCVPTIVVCFAQQKITSVDDPAHFIGSPIPVENHSPSLQQSPASTIAEIDTTHAFSSVREAVAILGERILACPKPPTIPKHGTSAPPKVSFSSLTTTATFTSTPLNQEKEVDSTLANLVKRLEVELEEMKRELKQLKERESETEIALASLNADLHQSMSRMAEAEAVEAGRAAARSGLIVERT